MSLPDFLNPTVEEPADAEDEYAPGLLVPEDLDVDQTIQIRRFALEIACKGGVSGSGLILHASMIEKWMMTGGS